jgi:hypothetical protein
VFDPPGGWKQDGEDPRLFINPNARGWIGKGQGDGSIIYIHKDFGLERTEPPFLRLHNPKLSGGGSKSNGCHRSRRRSHHRSNKKSRKVRKVRKSHRRLRS